MLPEQNERQQQKVDMKSRDKTKKITLRYVIF